MFELDLLPVHHMECCLLRAKVIGYERGPAFLIVLYQYAFLCAAIHIISVSCSDRKSMS